MAHPQPHVVGSIPCIVCYTPTLAGLPPSRARVLSCWDGYGDRNGLLYRQTYPEGYGTWCPGVMYELKGFSSLRRIAACKYINLPGY